MKYRWMIAYEADYRFLGWGYASKTGFSIKDYTTVQTGSLKYEKGADPASVLDTLFEVMNTNYEAHKGIPSMSTSDIVILYDEDVSTVDAYYCDVYGWRKLSMDELFGVEVM